MKKYYEIYRNDGRKAVNYTFDSKREAEKTAKKLADPKHPFTYKVREVKPS